MSRPTADGAAEIRLLGELEVRHEGRLQTLPASKKTRALLGYLVLTGRPQLRERLCALLWEGPDDPRAALRWSLSKIRPLLDRGGGALAADRDRAGFVAGGVAVDVTVVRRLLSGGGLEGVSTEALREATELFRGELLEGLDLPACYHYREWCVSEREQLRALRVGALAELVARLSRSEDALEEALVSARQRVAVDPLTEAAHIDVIKILGRLGRVREGQAQVESCRRILETELGARPSQALDQARRDLTTTPPTTPPTARPIAPSPRGRGPILDFHGGAPDRAELDARPPLVGRDAPRQAIEAAVAATVVGGAGPLLFFVGDPGIGKTRLLDLVVEEMGAARGMVVRGRSFEAEMVRPYGPWLDALRGAPPPAGVDLAPLAPWLGGEGSRGGELASMADRSHLFDVFVGILSAWSRQAGALAVVLDDVQWLDEASAALLHFVGRAALGGRVLLACAARSGELGDNGAALRVVRALQRERRLVQHRIAPLGAAETAALVRSVHPGIDVDEAFASSEGNPLFALELARSADADANASALGDSLEGLLDERIARLEDTARELLSWAAALGRSFDPEVLGRVSGIAASPLLAALERLERHGIVRPAVGAYDFTHDLLRRAAYRRLSAPRRRLVHLQIARQLHGSPGGPATATGAGAGGDDDDSLSGEIAHHAALGGDASLAAEASLVAGRRCLRLFAFAEAAELALRGLSHLPRLERQARIHLQLELYTVLVDSGQSTRRMAGFEDELTRAIVEAQDAGLHADAARGFHLRSKVHFNLENIDGAQQSSLQAVEETHGITTRERIRQLADSARCLMLLERDVPRAQALVEEARALVAPRDAEATNVAWALGLLGRYLGDYALAAPAFAAAIEGFGRQHAHWEQCLAMAQRVMLELERGDPTTARALCPSLVEVASKLTGGSERATAAALAALAGCALEVGGAAADLERAIAALREVDAKAMLAYALNGAAVRDLLAGEVDGAQGHAAAALTAAQAVQHRSEMAVAHAILGEVALRRGDRRDGQAHLTEARRNQATALALSARAVAAVTSLGRALSADVAVIP